LADVLVEQGRVDEAIDILHARVDAGDKSAAERLADVLAGQGRVDEAIDILQALADAGDESIARRLADLERNGGRGALRTIHNPTLRPDSN
jgi:predicted negative regulator of RcsB-dependent stress response